MDNPYQSPLDLNVSEYSAQQTHVAPFRFVGIGLFAGSILGSTFGAGHAAIVAVVAILFRISGNAPIASPTVYRLESVIEFFIAATIAGALIGLPIGLTIGLILGVTVGVSRPPARRPFYLVGIATATFAGAIASGVFAFDLKSNTQIAFSFYAIVLASGTAAGFLCGLCLVRGLAKLAWSQSAGNASPKGIDPLL